MNEVTTTSVGSLSVTRTTSLKGSVEAKVENGGGKDLPLTKELAPVEKAEDSKPVDSKPVDNEVKKAEIKSAVAAINEFVQSIQRDLHFTVDEELDQTVIKVMDSGSGELIRQIPEEVVLELARKLNDDGEFQLVNALG